jgi:SAM-dependent methyltransferase
VSHRPCVVCGTPDPTPQFQRNGFDMVACRHCGCVYVGQDPGTIDFDKLYGQDYYTGGHDQVFTDYVGQQAARRAHARRKLWMLRHLPLFNLRIPHEGHLLDVGCAAGFFLAEAQAHYTVQGVELSSWSSAWARDHLKLPVITGTLQQAALAADRFDVITLWDVIEHVPDPVPLLTEAARVLKPGGQLILTTGDWGSAYARRHGADWHLMTPPWHLTMFSRDTLTRAAARAGLKPTHWASEGVMGDGPLWRNKAALLATRLLDKGDIVRLTLTK